MADGGTPGKTRWNRRGERPFSFYSGAYDYCISSSVRCAHLAVFCFFPALSFFGKPSDVTFAECVCVCVGFGVPFTPFRKRRVYVQRWKGGGGTVPQHRNAHFPAHNIIFLFKSIIFFCLDARSHTAGENISREAPSSSSSPRKDLEIRPLRNSRKLSCVGGGERRREERAP